MRRTMIVMLVTMLSILYMTTSVFAGKVVPMTIELVRPLSANEHKILSSMGGQEPKVLALALSPQATPDFRDCNKYLIENMTPVLLEEFELNQPSYVTVMIRVDGPTKYTASSKKQKLPSGRYVAAVQNPPKHSPGLYTANSNITIEPARAGVGTSASSNYGKASCRFMVTTP